VIREHEKNADVISLRAHTHGMLRRYLHASMQPCRVTSTLSGRIYRGWVSTPPIRCLEDAMIFVHDMEKCIESLPSLDRDILTRIVIQEYTQAEAAVLIGMSVRTMSYKFPAAMDRLTRKLIEAELLILPNAA
jgi:ribosomal protein L28